jgi:hypothetical protein
MTARCEKLPGRAETWRVLAGGLVHVGEIRLDRGSCRAKRQEMRWVARSVSGSIRRFVDKFAAVSWLVEREPDPGRAEPGRPHRRAPA